MNYSLAINIDENETKEINIDKCMQYMKDKSSLNIKYSLLTIDEFTTQFSDENELKEFLISNDLVSDEYKEYPLIITKYPNTKQDNLAILYKDSISLFDDKLLFSILYANYLTFNYNFISNVTKLAKNSKNDLGFIAGMIYDISAQHNKAMLSNLLNGFRCDNDSDIITYFVKQLFELNENYEVLHNIVSTIARGIYKKDNHSYIKQLIKPYMNGLLGQQSIDNWYYQTN